MMILKNTFKLTFLQVVNYVAPFIMLPLIATTYNVVDFGSYGLALIYGSYAGLIVEYGFNLKGVRDYARCESVLEKNELFVEILCCKCSISMLVISFVSVSLWFLKYDLSAGLIFPAVISFVIQALVPNWYHQSGGNFNIVVVSTLIGKFIYLAFAVANISLSGPLSGIFWSLAFGNLVALLISMSAAKIPHLSCLLRSGFTRRGLIDSIKSSMPFFAVTIAPHFYTSLLTLHAAQYLSLRDVGLFIAAERLFYIAKQASAPFLQLIYPQYQVAKSLSDVTALVRIRRSVQIVLVLSCVGSFIIFWQAENILTGFYGVEYTAAARALKVLMLGAPLIIITNYFGILRLFHLGLEKYTAIVMVVVGVIAQLLLFLVLDWRTELSFVASLFVLGELLVGLIFFIATRLERLIGPSRA